MIQFYFITFLFISFHKFLIGAKSVKIQFITNNNNNNKNSNRSFRFFVLFMDNLYLFIYLSKMTAKNF